jgi:hypothetical protein
VLDILQTREELYAVLKYYDFEHKLDELYARGGNGEGTKPRRTRSARKKR